MWRTSPLAIAIGFGVLVTSSVACSARDEGAGGESTAGALTESAPTDTCTVEFTWWQKDAYSHHPGRHDAWPPHTTTELTVTCGSEVVAHGRANHGTEVGTTDDAGTPMLTKVKSESVSDVPRTRAIALGARFDTCECGTKFMSMDSLKEGIAPDFIEHLAGYVALNATCPDVGVDTLVAQLRAHDMDAVARTLPGCSWAPGTGLEGGMNESLSAVVEPGRETIDDYHVCNNDAKLEATLWRAFVNARSVDACDPNASLCKAPLWFYQP